MIVHESLKNNIFHTDYGNEFKNQLIGDTLDALKLLLADYVNWFNNHRIHSSPGCLTPVEYRMNKLKKVVWFTVDNPAFCWAQDLYRSLKVNVHRFFPYLVVAYFMGMLENKVCRKKG